MVRNFTPWGGYACNMKFFKKPESREEKKYKIIGILSASVIGAITIYIFLHNLDLNYYREFLKDDIIGFVVHIILLIIAGIFIYATIGLVIYTFIIWLISIITLAFSKNKNAKKEAREYLFKNDDIDDD